MFFLFKQKTAYEMRISDGVQTCALPISFLFGGIFLNTSWIFGGGADGGWFAYAPNTGVAFSPSHGMDFYALGVQITGIASLVGAVNLITTVLNMRAPGMTLMKMPVFTWMSLVTQVLLLFSLDRKSTRLNSSH